MSQKNDKSSPKRMKRSTTVTKKQDAHNKGKRPLEEEEIKPRKNVKEIKLGGCRDKYYEIRSNEYLDNLVNDNGTQKRFLRAIHAYIQTWQVHPLEEEDNIKDFLTDALGVVGVEIDDFKKAIHMVWPDRKDLEQSAIEKALGNIKFPSP